VRRAIAGALGEIGSEDAVAPLVARLDDEDANVRRASFACVIKHYGLFDAELDLVIISRDLDGIEPFLDPQTNIATKHLKCAAEKLDRPLDEIVARVSAIAEALGLPLLQGQVLSFVS
jgi:HEAT repeat protein